METTKTTAAPAIDWSRLDAITKGLAETGRRLDRLDAQVKADLAALQAIQTRIHRIGMDRV